MRVSMTVVMVLVMVMVMVMVLVLVPGKGLLGAWHGYLLEC